MKNIQEAILSNFTRRRSVDRIHRIHTDTVHARRRSIPSCTFIDPNIALAHPPKSMVVNPAITITQFMRIFCRLIVHTWLPISNQFIEAPRPMLGPTIRVHGVCMSQAMVPST